MNILHQTGVLRKLELRWFTKGQNSFTKEDSVEALGIQELSTLYAALIAWLLGSLLILSVEKYFKPKVNYV